MKIIERSEKPGWCRQFKCTGSGNGGQGCKSLLEVEQDDLRYFEGVPGDTWGSRDPAVSFKCPVCQEVTDIPERYWPYKYDERLKRYTTNWAKGLPEIELVDRGHSPGDHR